MTTRSSADPERQRIRRLVRQSGRLTAQLIRKVERDPELGPIAAAAIERHARDVLRVELLKAAGSAAWDLLDESRWPCRRKP